MNKPSFRLARLLELKRRLCRHAERGLRIASTERSRLRTAADAIRQQITDFTETHLAAEADVAGNWYANYSFLQSLQSRLEQAQQSLQAAECSWREALTKYEELMNEQQTLENLEERHLRDQQMKHFKSSQAEMDSFALRKWEPRG